MSVYNREVDLIQLKQLSDLALLKTKQLEENGVEIEPEIPSKEGLFLVLHDPEALDSYIHRELVRWQRYERLMSIQYGAMIDAKNATRPMSVLPLDKNPENKNPENKNPEDKEAETSA